MPKETSRMERMSVVRSKSGGYMYSYGCGCGCGFIYVCAYYVCFDLRLNIQVRMGEDYEVDKSITALDGAVTEQQLSSLEAKHALGIYTYIACMHLCVDTRVFVQI